VAFVRSARLPDVRWPEPNGRRIPFWSPDGKALGFFADSKLKTIELESGSVRMVSYAAFPSGATWNGNGVILSFRRRHRRCARVRQRRRAGSLVRLEAPQQFNHRSPQFLPDGRHFLYYVAGTPEARGVYIGDIDGGQSSRLLDSDSHATYAASGHLLFVRQGTLYGQAFAPIAYRSLAAPSRCQRNSRRSRGRRPGLRLSTGPIAYRAGVLHNSGALPGSIEGFRASAGW
jgi:hypothetical protein